MNAVITTPTISLPANATVGTAYTGSATASGGTAPITYSATGLPPGLSINPTTGAITGTPTTAGTYPVTITTTDATGATASANTTITVAAASGGSSCTTPTALTASPASTTAIAVGHTASYSVSGGTVSGGTAAYTWAVSPSTGVTPASGTGTTTGTITFATAGTYTVTFTATNSTTPSGCTTPGTSSAMVTQVVGADSDGDGIPDSLDQCPNTPAGGVVTSTGCPAATDLSITKTASVTNVVPGVPFTYTITVTNTGAEAQNVKASDLVPTGLTINSTSASNSGTATTSGQQVTATWAIVPAGATRTLTISVTKP